MTLVIRQRRRFMTRPVLFIMTVVVASLVAVTLAAGPETFGVAPALTEVTPLTKLIARPMDFDTKTVRVEGVVTAVCQMMGCWLALAPVDAPKGPTVLVKVDDGVIIFPMSARGRRATVQGVVQRVDAGDAEGREAAREHAEQGGRTEGTGSARWQLKATGAIVY
jgi:hypothetical protein